jgi:hypothetical protein
MKYHFVHFELDHAVQNDALEMNSRDEKWKRNTAFDLEDEEQDIDSCSAARQPIQLFFTWISSLWMFMDCSYDNPKFMKDVASSATPKQMEGLGYALGKVIASFLRGDSAHPNPAANHLVVRLGDTPRPLAQVE